MVVVSSTPEKNYLEGENPPHACQAENNGFRNQHSLRPWPHGAAPWTWKKMKREEKFERVKTRKILQQGRLALSADGRTSAAPDYCVGVPSHCIRGDDTSRQFPSRTKNTAANTVQWRWWGVSKFKRSFGQKEIMTVVKNNGVNVVAGKKKKCLTCSVDKGGQIWAHAARFL